MSARKPLAIVEGVTRSVSTGVWTQGCRIGPRVDSRRHRVSVPN